MCKRGEVVQRQVVARSDAEVSTHLAKKLSLLDAVDAQVAFQVGVQLDDLFRITGLLDDEVDEHALDFSRTIVRYWFRRCRYTLGNAVYVSTGSATGCSALMLG